MKDASQREQGYTIRRFTIGADWVEVLAPHGCDYASVINRSTVAMWESTNPDIPDSLDELGPGLVELITAPTTGSPRIKEGFPVLYLKMQNMDSGPGIAAVRFVL